MKLAVKNNEVVFDLTELVGITGMQEMAIIWVMSESKAYMYYSNSTNGIPPNSGVGRWVKDSKIKYKYLVSMVADDFDFESNNCTEITGVWAWYDYTFDRIGSQPGFMDWKCWQREIEAAALVQASGDINANWSVFSDQEKQVLCKVSLTNVSPANFVATFPVATDRLAVSFEYDRENRSARRHRYGIMRMYLFSKLSPANCFHVLNTILSHQLIDAYVDGIKGYAEHGQAGLKDYLLSTSIYAETGFTQQAYTVIDGSGDTLEDVANVIVTGIMETGMY